MKFSSTLLAAAAGFVTVSAAQAADLPGEAVPAAVDYVKVCDTFGEGFFFIPNTETCLDISGRVRVTTRYDETFVDNLGIVRTDEIRSAVDARVQFDARSSTEYGQLRSFFELSSNSDKYVDVTGQVFERGVQVSAAFIQLGYVTTGYMGSLFNGDVLYGIDDAGAGMGDQFGLQVVVDDLGGGFFVGAAIEGLNDSLSTWIDTDADLPDFVLRAGVAGQTWGGVDVSFIYSDSLEAAGTEFFAVKGTANLVVAEGVDARLTAGYYDSVGEDTIMLSAAVAGKVSEAATVYAGLRYDIDDATADDIAANLGVDYTIVTGLVATGEVSYQDVNTNDSFAVIGRLTRNW